MYVLATMPRPIRRKLRRMRRLLLLFLTFSTTAHASPPPAASYDFEARARRIHRDAIVVDAHLDAPDQLADKWADLAVRGATPHFDLPRAREGGLTAPFFSIYVASSYAETGGSLRRALELIDLTQRAVAAHPKDLVMAGSVAEIRAARRAGKLAVLMGIEGGHAIEDSLGVLRAMYRAGVRYMTLTHTNTNHWADSSGPFFLPDFEPKASAVHDGLSDFGRAVVKEMNRLGMIVDISHTSDATVEDALAVSRAPIMASHSACRALADMPRNLTDDQIRRIAQKGGIVMLNFGSIFLEQKTWDAFVDMKKRIAPDYEKLKRKYAADPASRARELHALFDKQPALPRATLGRLADHLEHVMKVGGAQAAGLGSDFDGIDDPPTGLSDYAMLPGLSAELLRRGHSEAEVRGVLGENFLAFLGRVEKARAALASEPPGAAVYAK